MSVIICNDMQGCGLGFGDSIAAHAFLHIHACKCMKAMQSDATFHERRKLPEKLRELT